MTNLEAEYADLIARFAPSNPTRKLAEQYRAQGYGLDMINDFLRPIVLDIDAFEKTLNM